MSDRSRSASPALDEPRPKKQKTGGFKWKDKKPKDEEGSESRDSGRLERGYRNRSPRRESYRDRDCDDRGGERESRRDRDIDWRDDNGQGDSYRPADRRDRGDIRSRKSNVSHTDSNDTDAKAPQSPSNSTEPTAPTKPSKPKKPRAPVSNEPMIIVNINDRLGTKAAIPCLASDSVKAFKAMVAKIIGRQPHEIMLKRQGERPFKDQLSLQDYGVSNGVQLDLELDTGD